MSHRGRGQARRVLEVCCRVYSCRRRGCVSDPSGGAAEKKAYEGSVSVIRCGNVDTVVAGLVAISQVLW